MLPSGVTSALFCAGRRVFCCRIIRNFSVLNSQAVWTSSAGRRSSASKSEP
jgi:hypothetical protein